MTESLSPVPLSVRLGVCCFLAAGAIGSAAPDPGDWPMWGRTEARSMSCEEVGLVEEFSVGEYIGSSDELDPETMRNIKWIGRLGSQSYGNPTIAGGRVFVGTNNGSARDPRFLGDRSCVYCFDEATGKFLWQLNVPKLGTGQVSDWEYIGICSSPTVDGDRVYVVSNRCEVVCLDAKGMANGNDGYQDEGQYMAGQDNPPITPGETDADILWVYNMREELGIFPHNMTNRLIPGTGRNTSTRDVSKNKNAKKCSFRNPQKTNPFRGRRGEVVDP